MANIGYMQLVRHCNQYCRFCSNPTSEYMLDVETAKRQIDDFVKREYFGIILTGGEPSLSPHVPEITRYAVGCGLHVRMITNGTKVAEMGSLSSFVEAGLKHYHVSIHSCRPDVEDFLTGVKGSHARAMQALENLGRFAGDGVTVNINTVINAYNADHLHENVRFFCEKFPFIDHFVWNNLDPSMGRAETNRDTAPRLRDFEVSLNKAMRYLTEHGRTFRAERVPLCFMTEFAHCSTETRKIAKGEERMVHFLDEKGTVRQTDFVHLKSEVCKVCSLDSICGGLFDLGNWYDPKELSPVFVPLEPILERIKRQPDEPDPRSAKSESALHPSLEIPPAKRHWVRLTRVCNDHCNFCLDSEAQNGTSLPMHVVLSDLEKGRNKGLTRVVLSGGEPTMHPEFVDIVARAKGMGYDHIQTVTNGRRMCYSDFLSDSVKAGLKEVTFSLHGHTPELHDSQTGSPGSFLQGLIALRRALKTPNLIVSVDVVVSKQNIRHLADILQFFINEGIREFDLLQVIPFGAAWENKEELFYDVDAEISHWRRALEIGRRAGAVLWTNRLKPQYLEGFEYLIQPPSKLHDEFRGRGVMFESFLRLGIKPFCWGRCKHCFLEPACADMNRLKQEKTLESYPVPQCLKDSLPPGEPLKISHDAEMPMEQFVDFYIQGRYFVKGAACRSCVFNESCSGAPIDYVRRNGFPKPKPEMIQSS